MAHQQAEELPPGVGLAQLPFISVRPSGLTPQSGSLFWARGKPIVWTWCGSVRKTPEQGLADVVAPSGSPRALPFYGLLGHGPKRKREGAPLPHIRSKRAWRDWPRPVDFWRRKVVLRARPRRPRFSDRRSAFPRGRPGTCPPRSPHLTMVKEVPGHSLLAAHYGTSTPSRRSLWG